MHHRLRLALALLLALAGSLGGVLLAAGPASAMTTTLYVSPSGSSGGADTSCSTAAYSTIQSAVNAASAGGTIVVCSGSYAEDVTVSTSLTIEGQQQNGQPVVVNPSGLSGQYNGFTIEGTAAAGTTLEGFVVEQAYGEGILVKGTSDVTIKDNRVNANDQGQFASSPTYPECMASGPVPGDCGEGVHLWSVTNSTVTGNDVEDNSGGILLTGNGGALLANGSGPTSGNLILDNTVSNNLYDCGITLASLNPNAAPSGKPTPSTAGVYGNTLAGNRVDNNGTVGEGAGILMAGVGTYSNVIVYNEVSGNGMPGITIHQFPGQDVQDNQIIGNDLSGNAITGNNGKPGDSDAGLTSSADIEVFSILPGLTGTELIGNTVSNAYYGIWTDNAPPRTVSGTVVGPGITRTEAFYPENLGSTIHAGQYVYPGQYLTSPNGTYHLVMQWTDGNMVLYAPWVYWQVPVWSSGTYGHPGAYAVMQGDGNLVIYSVHGRALWSSGTSGHPGAYAIMQGDRNFVVYWPWVYWQVPLWATGTWV